MIGSTVGQELAGALNLTVRDIQAIGNNFTKVVIGETGLGAITLASDTDLTSVDGSSIEILGDTITLQAGIAGGAVQVPGKLTLAASGDIVLDSGISTATTNDVTMVSSNGSLTMAQGTRLDSRGGNIDFTSSKDLAIGTVDARSADLSVSGVVTINAGSGTVTDANQNGTADIFAKAINFTGYGPVTGSTGDVLEVVAEVVQITVPQGIVVRDTGADGRTAFNVMNSGKLYQQLVVEGVVTRVTEDPNALLNTNKTDAELIAAGIPRNSQLLQNPVDVQFFTASMVTSSTASNMTTLTAVSRYLAAPTAHDSLLSTIDLSGLGADVLSGDLLSDSSYGLANRLQQAYVLGTPGEQPFVSGLDTFSQDTFEYWVDTLSL
jgi:hypothetical protein